MAEWQCVEPSMLQEKPEWLALTDKSWAVLKAPAEDTVVFPHVDVCLAIAWLRSTKVIVAGHVPAQWDAHSPIDMEGCAKRIMVDMDKLQSEANIEFVITLGDRAWKSIVDRMVDIAKPKQQLSIWKDIPGGGDLRIDGTTKKISVNASRTRQLVREWSYDTVQKEQPTVTYTTPVLFKIAENLKVHFKEEPFKGSESLFFHSLCPQKDQQEITQTFKSLFKKHGKCTEFWAPLGSTLNGDLSFKFADAEKVSFSIVAAESLSVSGRYLIKELTLNLTAQQYAEKHGSSMQFARR